MHNEPNDKLEQHIRFVAKHYGEGRLDTDRAWQRFAAGHPEVRRDRFRHYWIGAAAVLLLLIGLGTFFWTERPESEWVAVTTRPDQLKEIYLPDSTRVSLAGGSSVRYDRKSYGKEWRAVEMTGKAFFQVMRNEARPFSVTTAETVVTVLGTSFQVHEAGSMAEVHVATGKVSFASIEKKESVVLTAGMSATYSKEREEITVSSEPDGNANWLTWKTGKLQFNETPLEQVIADLSAYYWVKIRNRSVTPGLKLTATFDRLPLGEVLMVINQTLDTRLVAEPGPSKE